MMAAGGMKPSSNPSVAGIEKKEDLAPQATLVIAEVDILPEEYRFDPKAFMAVNLSSLRRPSLVPDVFIRDSLSLLSATLAMCAHRAGCWRRRGSWTGPSKSSLPSRRSAASGEHTHACTHTCNTYMPLRRSVASGEHAQTCILACP